jgi:hypothetical protein
MACESGHAPGIDIDPNGPVLPLCIQMRNKDPQTSSVVIHGRQVRLAPLQAVD